MKKFLSIILLICICSTFCVSTNVFATNLVADGGSDEDFRWKLDDEGVLTIGGTGDMKNYQLGAAPWYNLYKDDIMTVVIENGISSIGTGAFYDCKNLNSVSIPDSVTNIGGNAFMACENLESIEIPDSVVNMNGAIFRGCKSLIDVSLPSEITRIAGETFYKCVNLSNIELPSSVAEIGKQAFYGCEKLNNITLSKNVTRINSNAFAQCNSLFNISYEGNESDWENITIDYGNTILENAEIKYLSDDEIPTTNICFICSKEINADDVVYDENNQPLCHQCADELSEVKEQYIELDCPNCSEILEITGDEYNERKYIVCPYCNEIVDGDSIRETECYICGEYFNADDMLYDEDDNLICQNCYDEFQTEEQEATYIECPYCYETFEDNDDIYDEEGYAVCPYCDGIIDTLEEVPEEIEFEFATSDWAVEEVYEAYQNGLIPDEMLETALYKTISREEFAAIAVKLCENIVGEVPYVDIYDTPFTDCNYASEYNNYIATAYELGITKGTSDTTFSPYENITREQLATMLSRVALPPDNRSVSQFADHNEISQYAIDAVYLMAMHDIIKGVGDNRFAPQETATKEQAILIALRIYNSYSKW